MTRIRIVSGALISAAVLALAGCGTSAPEASWHPGGSPASGGQGGEQPMTRPINNDTAQAVKPASSASGSPSTSAPASAVPSGSTSPAASDGIIRQTGTDAVALTFDDGPGTDTPKLLAMLREHNIKATFCVIGVNVQEYPDMVQQIVADGHTLCNHTWKHDESLGKKSADAIRTDLQRTNDEIHKIVPDAQIKYFRHPGGRFTPAAVQIAKDLGMASLGWTVDPSDWNMQKWSGQRMTEHIVAVVRNNTKPGSIVLSHDGGGDRTGTLNAYRTLLPELAGKFSLIALP